MVWLHYCTVWAADNLYVSSVTEPQELYLALIISLEKTSVIQLGKKNMHRCFRAKRKDWSRSECPPIRHAAANHGQYFPHLDTCTEADHVTSSPQWNIYSYRPCNVRANMGHTKASFLRLSFPYTWITLFYFFICVIIRDYSLLLYTSPRLVNNECIVKTLDSVIVSQIVFFVCLLYEAINFKLCLHSLVK